MDRNRNRAAGVALLLTAALLLSGCTKNVSERCSGRNYESTCTVTFGESDGKWSTSLDGGTGHSTIVINGTFTIESGSGTLALRGAESGMEYTLSPEQPVVVEDLRLELIEGAGGSDSRAVLETTTDGTIEGFSAEYTFVTSP